MTMQTQAFGRLSVAMTGKSDITFTRRFDASPALVWRALTEPALIRQWLWAHEWPMTECMQDFREGGTLRWVWGRPDGRSMGVSGRFVTIEAPRRLVHTERFDEDWTGGETQVETVLAEVAPQTTGMVMVVRYATPEARAKAAATAMSDGMEEAYARLDGKLAGFLRASLRSDFAVAKSGARGLVVTRSFAARAAQVRRALLEPALVRQWMSSAEYPMTGLEIDARIGGRFRFAWAMPDGSTLAVSGQYTELGVTRIAHVETFEPDWTGGPAEVVTTLTEAGGRTVVRVEITYASPEARDAVAASGMSEGMAATYDQLEALLAA